MEYNIFGKKVYKLIEYHRMWRYKWKPRITQGW